LINSENGVNKRKMAKTVENRREQPQMVKKQNGKKQSKMTQNSFQHTKPVNKVEKIRKFE